jgi:hypothetical protein
MKVRTLGSTDYRGVSRQVWRSHIPNTVAVCSINKEDRDPDLGFNGETVGGTTGSKACRPASTPMLVHREHRTKLLRQTGRLRDHLRFVGKVHASKKQCGQCARDVGVRAKPRHNREEVTARLIPSLILYLHGWLGVPDYGVASP